MHYYEPNWLTVYVLIGNPAYENNKKTFLKAKKHHYRDIKTGKAQKHDLNGTLATKSPYISIARV